MTCAAAVAAAALGLGWYIAGAMELGAYQVPGSTQTLRDTYIDHTPDSLRPFFLLLYGDHELHPETAELIRAGWTNANATMLLEIARFSSRPHYVLKLLEEMTGQAFDGDREQALSWVWANDFGTHPDYAQFKAVLYSRVDPRFATYFDDHTDNTLIRLDEVRWGGVRRDGIPPLKNPKMIDADDADYLEDDHIVFGISINGDARAYPKRILAWHEMFKDTVGGVSINGVYCTLCGSMIVYKTEHDGFHHELGTSGFLYRSNKLMYDHATESMWSTLRGKPVIGPLVGKGIELEPLYVVTTTWGQWRRKHPDTTVLSLETGHYRNYDEGEAYRDYFATDELMFSVPSLDDRLANKAEVLVLRFGAPLANPVVIDTAMLTGTPVFQGDLGGVSYAVLTDPSGANRVYEVGDLKLSGHEGAYTTDQHGRNWAVKEHGLVGGSGQTLPRLPAHRAFWFGWYAANPDTELIR